MSHLKIIPLYRDKRENNFYVWYFWRKAILSEKQEAKSEHSGILHGVRLRPHRIARRWTWTGTKADVATRKIYHRFPSIFGLALYD